MVWVEWGEMGAMMRLSDLNFIKVNEMSANNSHVIENIFYILGGMPYCIRSKLNSNAQ